ncbi:MAG: amidohydrolase family protein [Burkholderiaceae bacterium]|nr:amidohydrolase family protein [Burkholderiaceae bacterium]
MTDRPSYRLFSSCNCDAPLDAGLSRRRFLGGGAALGALAASGCAVTPGAARPHRVDVHHHVVAPDWLAALKSARRDYPRMSTWTPAQSIADMDAAGIATSITSPTEPQVAFMNAQRAAPMARHANEYAKKLMGDYPGRFGVFAMLPLPHIDASLKEIEYAFDVLKVDGVGILTNYGNKWLGHPDFAPVFAELNRRRAVVYTHPTTPDCCVNLVPGVAAAAVELGADTTRSIANLIFSGASRRYSDIKFIFSHGGGVLTSIAERLQYQLIGRPPYESITKAIMDGELQRFYYDTAQVSLSVTIGALAKLVPTTQILFGTDYPFRTSLEHVQGLSRAFGPADLALIDRANALRLLPRLA